MGTGGILYAQLTYKSFKTGYMTSICCLLLAMQAYAFFEVTTMSIIVVCLSFVSSRVLDRNYISYCSVLSIQWKQE